MPNLSGLSADDAQRAVAERGLSFEDADQETDAVPPGQVFQQQPASGTRVTRGSRVLATVAVAVPILVPNVVGVTRQRAVALLEAAGLRAGPEPDATASSRLVERQQPARQHARGASDARHALCRRAATAAAGTTAGAGHAGSRAGAGSRADAGARGAGDSSRGRSRGATRRRCSSRLKAALERLLRPWLSRFSRYCRPGC